MAKTKKELAEKLNLNQGKLEQEKHELRERIRKIDERHKMIEERLDSLKHVALPILLAEPHYTVDIDDLVKDAEEKKTKSDSGNTFLAFIGGLILAMVAFSL